MFVSLDTVFSNNFNLVPCSAVQPLAASMGQDEFSSVQAAPAAKERHQFPLQVCTFPCDIPLGSASTLQLRCDAARGRAAFHSLGMLTGNCGKYRASALCTVCWTPNWFSFMQKKEAIVFREVKV